MTIKDVLSEFDTLDKKGFDFNEILNSLSKVDDNQKKTPEYSFEVLAFHLTPSNDSPWGTYYGPILTFKDQNGTLVYCPALEDITIKAIDYWIKRISETSNPLLKMQYSGLVWDFEKKIANRNHNKDLYTNYVDSMIQVINGDYCRHFVITVNVLERLFDLTKGNLKYLPDTKAAYKSFENRHAKDEHVGAWASQFLMMLEYKECFSDEEKQKIVVEHEARLQRLSKPDADNHVNPWLIQSQAGLLAKYYCSIKSSENLKRVLKIEEQSFMHESKSMSAMQLMGNLENLYKEYNHYHLGEEATKLLVEIQKLGNRVKAELQPCQMEFDIPQEVYEQVDLMFGDKVISDEERWKNFCIYFIPRVSNEEKSLKELVEKYPLTYMMPTNMLDLKGHPMSVVAPYENDPDGQLILHITQKLNLSSYFLDIAINKLLQTKTLTVEKVMKLMIQQSPIFEEDRYDIISNAIQYFIDGKYVLFNHLIVPQIEAAICNLVEQSGRTILKPQKKGKGFQLRILDDLLREPIISEAFTEDGAYYMRLVLTDQRALNIRNLLCHGLISPTYLGAGAAGRLLHVLAMLGHVRLM